MNAIQVANDSDVEQRSDFLQRGRRQCCRQREGLTSSGADRDMSRGLLYGIDREPPACLAVWLGLQVRAKPRLRDRWLRIRYSQKLYVHFFFSKSFYCRRNPSDQSYGSAKDEGSKIVIFMFFFLNLSLVLSELDTYF